MTEPVPTTYLLDLDNTLLDSDRIIDDLREHLAMAFGENNQADYWEIFEELHEELGYADYFGALQRYRCKRPDDPHFFKLSLFLLDYPFSKCLFPRSLDLIDFLSKHGRVAIVTNGDVVYQPHKIERAGLLDAVRGNLLIHIHKERDWEDIERRFPSHQYVIFDDEPQNLIAAKRYWRGQVTTVFVCQGKQACGDAAKALGSEADFTIASLDELFATFNRGVLKLP